MHSINECPGLPSHLLSRLLTTPPSFRPTTPPQPTSTYQTPHPQHSTLPLTIPQAARERRLQKKKVVGGDDDGNGGLALDDALRRQDDHVKRARETYGYR